MKVTPKLRNDVADTIRYDLRDTEEYGDIFGEKDPIPTVITIVCPNRSTALDISEMLDEYVYEDEFDDDYDEVYESDSPIVLAFEEDGEVPVDEIVVSDSSEFYDESGNFNVEKAFASHKQEYDKVHPKDDRKGGC